MNCIMIKNDVQMKKETLFIAFSTQKGGAFQIVAPPHSV